MTDLPIIFSAPMIKGLLREASEIGTGKSMTRRLAWGAPCFVGEQPVKPGHKLITTAKVGSTPIPMSLPPTAWQKAQSGDRLWIKETHFRWGLWDYQPSRENKWKFFPSRPDDFKFVEEMVDGYEPPKRVPGRLAWYRRPAIYHEKAHSRLTLVMTGAKIEPLNDISEQDCEREGVLWDAANKWWHVPGIFLPSGAPIYSATAREAFACLWDMLHGSGEWSKNPDVVALTFRVHAKNIYEMAEAA